MPYDKVLLPSVAFLPQPGLFGSMWVTRLAIINNSSDLVSIIPYAPNAGCEPCPYPRIRAGVTLSLTVPPDRATSRGTFLFIERPHVSNVDISLRAQDTTRQDQTWGTSLPVVREADFRRSSFSLADLPGTGAFRVAVRIYSLEPSRAVDVNVKIFAIDPTSNTNKPPDQLLGERNFTVPAQAGATNDPFFPYPGFAEVGSLGAIADVGSAQRVRVVVTPTQGDAIWAFAAVTHNETQHVTVVEPGR